MTSRRFEDVPARNVFEYLQMVYIVDVLRSIYPRNCALFEESMKVGMDKLWVILNKFRGGHKWNMQINGRGISL